MTVALALTAPAAPPSDDPPSGGVSVEAPGGVDPFVAALESAAQAHMWLAMRMLGTEEDARDAVQEAWFRAWRARGRMRETAAIHGWLRRIVARECLRLLRRRAFRRWLPFGPDVVEPPCWLPGPERQLEDAELRLRIRAAVDALPPKQRLAWGLRFDEGWSLAEIAAALEVSPETAKTHLARATATVRARMEPTDGL